MSRGSLLNVPVYVYRRRNGSTFETEQRMAEDAHGAGNGRQRPDPSLNVP